jgi:hypothetical protein
VIDGIADCIRLAATESVRGRCNRHLRFYEKNSALLYFSENGGAKFPTIF